MVQTSHFSFKDTEDLGVDQWLQYDFGEDRLLTQVMTKGRPTAGQYITSYQIQTWQGSRWQTVSDGNNDPIVRPSAVPMKSDDP